MASIYQRRGKWHIDYWVNGKRVTKNLKLTATIRNRKIAEDIKKEIENDIENMSVEYIEDNFQNPINPTSTSPITIDKAISKYKSRLTLRSKSHQVLFDVVITRLLEFISLESLVSEVTSEHIIEFIKSYQSEVANSTLITYLNYLKGFFNFMVEEGYIAKSPIRKKDLPRRERKRIITFENDMLEAILELAREKDLVFYKILMMMRLTGIRPNDVLRLKAGDFDFINEVINLKIAKTKKEIKFPIYNTLKHFLETDMNEIREIDKEQFLFPNYSVNRLGRKFRRLKVKLSITDKHAYTLKTFRKGFATEMSELLDIQYVAYLLGHDSPNTTVKYYSDVLVNKVRDKINKNINK